MQIRRLTLSHFRGFMDTTLDFKPGFNLIVGVNGAGKSSVLDALQVLISRAMPELTQADSFNLGFTADDITLGRGQMAASMDFDCHQEPFSIALTEQRDRTRSAVNIKTGFKQIKDIDPLSNPRRGARLKSGDLRLEGTLRGQTSTRPEVEAEISPKPDPTIKNNTLQPLVLHLSVRRAIANNRISKGQRRSPAYRSIFDIDRGLDQKGLFEWWSTRETVAREDTNSRYFKELTAVKTALQKVLPDFKEWAIVNNLLTVMKSVTVNQLDATGRKFDSQEDRRFFLSMLSDGERSLIAIVVDIAQRLAILNVTSDAPLETGEGLVLIDELDLHLHPKWQQTVIESLREAFPKLQFICTTHSPFLIQSQRIGNLIRLDEDGDEDVEAAQFHQQSIEDIVEDVQGVELPQKSKRYLDMMEAAENYYRRLHEVADESNPQLATLRQRLDELSIPFGDDPAFAALLKYEKETVAAGKAGIP